MGADAAARGTTPVVNGVQLESDPLSMNWDGSVLSGNVRVNNVSTGSTMTDIEARIFSISNVNIEPNDDTWNYNSAAEGLSSSFVNWAFSGSGGADFEFVVEVSWAPVPAKVAWMSYDGGNYEVYVANRDGTDLVNVSNYPDADESPSLSADGSKVAWMRYCDGNNEVYVANTDGTNVVNISNCNTADDEHPSLSADGSKVAWTSYRGGNGEVYVANTNDPEGLVNVSKQSGADDQYPSLSADGSKVAWTSYYNGNYEVYVANTDGTELVNVSNLDGYDAYPSLSADGSKVAWTSIRDGNYEVYVANTDGTGLVNVSREPYARDLSPSISADGSKVAWQSYGDWDYEVYIAKADGTGTAVNVSNHDEGDDYYASLQGN